jgi:hypothetical protein
MLKTSTVVVSGAIILAPSHSAPEASVASAQTFRGTILGTVTDPNGAVVPAATITVKNTSTGLESASGNIFYSKTH